MNWDNKKEVEAYYRGLQRGVMFMQGEMDRRKQFPDDAVTIFAAGKASEGGNLTQEDKRKVREKAEAEMEQTFRALERIIRQGETELGYVDQHITGLS